MRPVAAVLLLLTLAAGRQAKDDILGVKEWWGQISLKATHSGSRDGLNWDIKESSLVNVHLDSAVFAPWNPPASREELLESGRWGGWLNVTSPLRQVAHVDGTIISASSDGRVETSRVTRHEVTSLGVPFHFQIDLKRKVYSFTGPIQLGGHQSLQRVEKVTPGYPTIRQEMTANSWFGDQEGLRIIDQPLPEKGTVLKGVLRRPYNTGYPPGGGPPGEAVIEWSFSPRPSSPLQLEIEVTPDGSKPYAEWRPRPGPDERTPGSFLDVTAKVSSKDGSPVEEVLAIRLLLTDVSEERGVSLNYPPGSETKDPVPDLAFDPFYNRDVIVSDRRAHVVSPAKEIKARIAVFDGGAWGELMAEAEMVSGRYVLGHVKGQPNQNTLLIPQRRPNSKIADVWRSPGADDADPDNQPAGDLQLGDGLTNYEEYRGFHVQGVWTEGDPARKDFFVRNEAGGMADGGIGLFEQASKLRVHRLAPGELPPTRVVNAARTSGPHHGDQHAVVIRSSPQLGNLCRAMTDNGSPGMPRHVSQVALGNFTANVPVATVNPLTGQTHAVSYISSTVAHELFHCCNVYHHGDPQEEKTARTWKKEADGRITEDGTPIMVVDERGQDLSGQLAFPGPGGTLSLPVYVKGGVASGDVSCVMRYDDAVALKDSANPGVRILLSPDMWNTGEVTGYRLCSDKAPTGLNVNRFGAATRGRCSAQIVVNDSAQRTSR